MTALNLKPNTPLINSWGFLLLPYALVPTTFYDLPEIPSFLWLLWVLPAVLATAYHVYALVTKSKPARTNGASRQSNTTFYCALVIWASIAFSSMVRMLANWPLA